MKSFNEVRPATPEMRAWGISWPLLIWVAAVVGAIACKPPDDLLQDPDTYWHIAAGRWIMEHGSVPTADPFSHSMSGAPWIAFEWLSELVIFGAYHFGGWAGLVVLAASAYALVLAVMARFLITRMEPVHALLFIGLAAGMMMTHALARPHLLAWVLLAFWVSTLIEVAEAHRGPPWWLLGLMVLWANIHGSFLLGLALGAGIAVEAVLAHPRATRMTAARPWMLFVALSLIATLLTPSGWQPLAHSIYILQMKALASIPEWWSPNFQQPHPLEVWLLLILALALGGRVRLPWVRMVLVLGLVHLALKHQRNVSILGLVSPFLIATPFARQWYATSVPGRDAKWLDRCFLALSAPARPVTLALGVAGTLLFAAATTHLRPPAPAVAITPKAAIEAAMAAGAKGPVLNDYTFGGFLIYKGIPVLVDGRADLYGDPFLQRMVNATDLSPRESLLEFLNEYKIGWSLLVPGKPAIAVLDKLPGWRRIHADNTAVVHVRVDSAPSP